MRPLEPPDAPSSDDRLILVHVAGSGTEAYVLRGRLESEGIPVFIKGESEGPYRVGFGPVYLWVRADLEVQARLVLAEAKSGDLVLTEADDPAEDTDRSQAEQEST
jgi:hypothetical protein